MTALVTRHRAQEVHDLARARSGNYYGYGEAFTRDPADSTDCSGLVLQTAAWFGGRDDWPGNRYGSTESFRLDHAIVYDLGFKRLPAGGVAELGFSPVMLVGLQHGGGGIYSHTACTLMTMDIPGGEVKVSARGVDWESRGGNPGVRLYDGARAWNDPMFHDYWYLDAKLEGAAPLGDAVTVLTAATGVSASLAASILPAVQSGLTLSECTNPRRIAMWLAQIGHESDSFRATAEYASGEAYEGRADLGNTQPGDGQRFKGRSWIQITGRHNYGQLSAWAHSKNLVPSREYFIERPSELATLEYAGLGPTWYWTVARPDINALSDRGDLEAVTRRINGGTHGLADRRNRYLRAFALGDRLLALTSTALADDLEVDEMSELSASRSIYRTSDNPTMSLRDAVFGADACAHMNWIEQKALSGDPWAIGLVGQLATGNLPAASDPWAVDRARHIIAIIQQAIDAQGAK